MMLVSYGIDKADGYHQLMSIVIPNQDEGIL